MRFFSRETILLQIWKYIGIELLHAKVQGLNYYKCENTWTKLYYISKF